MEDLINEFIAETREMLEALGGEIVAWEAAPNERSRLDAIFRFVHTVKGNCGFFDLPRLETLSHAAEDALAEVRSGKRMADPRLVSAVLAIIDRIGELVQALETGEPIASADDEHLVQALAASGDEAAPAPVAVAGAIVEQRKAQRSVRLSVDLLDSMMSGVSDLVLARNELCRQLRDTEVDAAVEAAFDRVATSIAEIRDAITRTRMQRIENLFVALPRMVRDLASELGKEVVLEVDGQDVELDREMIDMMRDPLTHIVRNALDHGIESPDVRRKAGKSPTGILRVRASQSGNQILIEISDDGRGIDGEKLVSKAIAAGLVTEVQAERLSAAQKSALIFEPGLSTAAEVTAVSGRGVGMDVVRANIERIGGTVDVESEKGRGLRLTLRVPLTLSIIPALTVAAGGQVYAVPRSAVDEIVRVKNDIVRIDRIGGSQMVSLRGRRIPLISLASVLGIGDMSVAADQMIIVLKPAGGGSYGLAVDAVHDHAELVIKPAAPAVMTAGLYAGTTLADDGHPILLLDASGIAASAGISLAQKQVEAPECTAEGKTAGRPGAPALLFSTMDGVKRAISLAVVERIEDVPADAVKLTAGKLRIALGDKILPLAGCSAARGEAALRVLRLSDGDAELAYGFGEVIDLVTLDEEVKAAAVPGEIGGVTLIRGDQVEVMDPYWLFATHHSRLNAATSRPVCAIPADDPWMHNILRPIVESAGYRVVIEGEVPIPDITIASAEASVQHGDGDTEIIRIRALPEAGSMDDDSIYRYDRTALVAALGRRMAGKADR
jgi:two-component system chemotaxis sensor kinase CheA